MANGFGVGFPTRGSYPLAVCLGIAAVAGSPPHARRRSSRGLANCREPGHRAGTLRRVSPAVGRVAGPRGPSRPRSLRRRTSVDHLEGRVARAMAGDHRPECVAGLDDRDRRRPAGSAARDAGDRIAANPPTATRNSATRTSRPRRVSRRRGFGLPRRRPGNLPATPPEMLTTLIPTPKIERQFDSTDVRWSIRTGVRMSSPECATRRTRISHRCLKLSRPTDTVMVTRTAN